jgi:hypothetical protein
MTVKGVELPELKKLGMVVVTPFKMPTVSFRRRRPVKLLPLKPSSGGLIEAAVDDLLSGHEQPAPLSPVGVEASPTSRPHSMAVPSEVIALRFH